MILTADTCKALGVNIYQHISVLSGLPLGQAGEPDVVFWLWAPAQRPRVGAALTATWDLGKHLYLCLLAVGQQTSQPCRPGWRGQQSPQSQRPCTEIGRAHV